MLHTFYFSVTPNSSRFVSMCAGGDIMDKTIREVAQILQRISNGQRTQRDWQRRCREEQNDKSKPKVLAEFFEKCPIAWLISHQPIVLFCQNKPATSNQPVVLFSQNKSAPATSQTNRLKDELEVKEDEPIIQEIEDPLPKVREVISDIKNIETNMNVCRSMGNARPLAEFNQSGWIQVDFAPLINYQRKEERRHVAKLVENTFDQEMSGESIQKIFEEEREEDDEGWINQFDNSKICNEGRVQP
jgi:hypothetical protein